MPHIVWSDGTISIVKIVSLSPHVKKPKRQEGNKSFVPELKKVISVSGSYACEHFYTPVYFTYLYHGYVILSMSK